MGDKAVVVGVVDDIGEGMQCMDHPYRGNTGGVCAFCLQEKLGKLVSSSKSSPFFSLQPPPFSSSSSPTSFSSDVGDALGIGSGHSRTGPAGAGRRTKFSFLAANHREKKKKKKKKNGCAGGGYGNGGRKVMASIATTTNVAADTASACDDTGVVLKRSKSVEPRMAGGLMQGGCGSGTADAVVADSPRKKSFWSFLYLSSASSTYTSSSAANNSGNSGNVYRRRSTSSSVEGGGRDITNRRQQQRQTSSATSATRQGGNSGEEAESPSGSQASSSLGRKVARSRSVGCGSRSFSGDFLERISTGFGDCTLRRAESHREAKSKIVLHLDQHHNNGEQQQQRSGTKERVKCGGIFGGLALTSAAADVDFNGNRRISETTAVHGNRTRSWVWAFASPMRAFRPYSSCSKPLHGINKAASASAAPATNIISAINASNDMFNKGNTRLPGNPSSLAIEI
ncbi:hypothetical protein B296_00056182 [Ensete ventricosum]|uniref:DUF740 domain-containing protein n=1 Tax=Ensete ventricosum TaxID=4639 RepID=A0A426XTN3_ENSVE|nr:hypothetical protein B296_00056182 [Ensete ventricosum]